MPDNITAKANTGAGTDILATDEIGGVHYPREKIGYGADGSYTDVSPANPLPVTMLGGATVPDNNAVGANVRPIGQDIWAVSFADSGASVLSAEFRSPDVSAGVTYNQTAGALNVVTGTGVNAEFLTRSVKAWRGAWALRFSTVLSQRIANQNFAVLMADLVGENLACTINSATSITVTKAAHGFTALNVGQFMFVGGISGAAGAIPGRYAIASVPTADTINFTVAGWPASGTATLDLFGHSHVRHIYSGTTATNVLVDAQRRGWTSGDTVATINSTATPGHVMQTHEEGRTLTFADTLRASTAAPNVVTRASRIENIPDDNLDLYLFLWSFNGSTAPATSTTWTTGFVSVEKFANTPVYVQGQRAQGTVAPGPVAVVGTATVAISGTPPVVATPATPTAATVNSAATTNGTVVKASAGTIYGIVASNTGASVRYLKLHNSATVTPGTTAVALTIALPVNGTVTVPFGELGMRYGTGICLSITGAAADADTTVIGAGEVKVNVAFI